MHIFGSVGTCRLKTCNGQAVEIGQTRINGCPLAKQFEIHVDEISNEAIKKTIERNICSLGMCPAQMRVISDHDFFGFAPTELRACSIRNGIIAAIMFA